MQIRAQLVDLRIDMAIDDEDVLPAVIGKIHEGIAPPHIAARATANARGRGDIGEVHVAVIAIKRRILIVKMRDEKRHAPCMQIVAYGEAHVGLPGAALIEADAGCKTDLLKNTLAVVLVEIVWLAVVGYEQVELAVVGKVRPDGGEPVAMFFVRDAGFL